MKEKADKENPRPFRKKNDDKNNQITTKNEIN